MSTTSFVKTGVIVVAIVAAFCAFKGLHPIVSIFTLKHMLEIGAHGFYGIGLFTQSSLSSHPVTDFVDIGYANNLKLKYLYFMRYVMSDNFLWEDWHTKLSDDIIALLESRGAKKDDQQIYAIPNFDYNEIAPLEFFEKFVKLGRPAIIHNFPTTAMKLWTPDYIASKMKPNYTTGMRCGGRIYPKVITEYVQSKSDPNATVCYIDNNVNVFTDHPELEAELEIDKFSAYALNTITPKGTKVNGYFFSQLFMGVFPSLGATYHCANYNNLFFMIKGRKKWTFVDSSHSFFLYPTFPSVMRTTFSRLNWYMLHNEHSKEMIMKYYPLLRYAPKYEYILQPGDVLFNPSWNWHMVENLDDESIGVASRWKMPGFYPYTNALFSLLHFISLEFWEMLYIKIASQMGVTTNTSYKPLAHLEFDDNVNFGKVGSMYKHRDVFEKTFAPNVWKQYMDYIKQKSEEHGVDYFKLNE
mmetsp:Transcript_2710/g.3722  ORF Transcript_2710/g.3722 Transcript_2710/m.3722 type:complete len:469 (+) Transcript_2710:29-1435(+)|eukprot:CAMPEP_0170074844 /NCGR_PEP_ID=MMETSP0019_2-20121128/12088_1 /TAXON_ID=98059 /ORGANISM="Dinobryon sp., Strain UTEXLB2267" /LENGTH=468 /DNA_ID=CAMNT_0010285433 /DNA_START=13 /DNA_END=1419 /DNA_ORIENTATION=-